VGGWDLSPGSVADVRALGMSCAVFAAMVTQAPQPRGDTVRLLLPDFTESAAWRADRPELVHVAGAFLRMVPLLSGGLAARPSDPTIRTLGGGAPTSTTDSGTVDYWQIVQEHAEIALLSAPLGPLAIPLQFAAFAMTAQKIALDLSGASGDLQTLLIYLDALKMTVLLHQAGEQKVGHSYPWTEPEMRTLKLVLDAQEVIARKKNLLWLVPSGDPLSFLRPNAATVQTFTDALAGALQTIVVVGALGAGAYLLLLRKSQ
jgi:hypothetical protein